MKVVTICGSMRYQNEMMEIARDLETKKGYCVIQCVYNLDKGKITNKQMEKVVNAHWKKIDISDAIYVLNINGYIGQSTNNEIEYAKAHNKEIIYHEK